MRGSQSLTTSTFAQIRGSECASASALPKKRGWLCTAALTLALCFAVTAARADEIRLKDGKKLYGVIVAYEDNMFKVKTDFGYVLVEKDKIASIVPSTPASETPKTDKTPAAKKDPATNAEPKAEPAVASSAEGTATAKNATAKSAEPGASMKHERIVPKFGNTEAKPEVPAATKTNAVAPAISGPAATPAPTLAASTAQPAAPKEPEPPAIREDIQGNLYTNYTHGFRMYKAPSWVLNDEARKSLPDAIVALGTLNQSTLMVIGQEQTKTALEPAAAAVEKRLSEIYENYRRISQRKTMVGGLPAMEYHYRGLADGHDWSGTLVVISRGTDVFTVLGMTYGEDDLIQIQENVISRSIASMDFNVH
jgi:hypothetical protein